MKVKRKFLKLTKYTYPYGKENLLKDHLPKNYKEDGLGNFYFLIGESPSTMFTCHLDTACKEYQKVNHVIIDGYIHTDKKTILGADDKAGMVVLLSLIEKNIPGLYYFFIGEEVGCIGSSRVSETWETNVFSKHIKKVISFDRKGTDSVITDQLYGTCCSNEFASDLSNKLNIVDTSFKFKPDHTGVFTDSAKFMELVPECTNISVGYYNEHTVNEKQDIIFLNKLCNAVVKIDWESLPVKRTPGEFYMDYYERFYSNGISNKKDSKKVINDSEWSENYFSYFSYGGSSSKMYIAKTYIKEEEEMIENWLNTSCAFPGYNSFSWNGNSLYIDIEYSEHVGNRKDLLFLIPKLTSVPKKYLKTEDELFNIFK